jgi:hypothetical protein
VRAIYLAFFAFSGIVATGLFHLDIYLPISFSVLIFVFLSFWFINEYRQKRIGMLMLLIWLVYALPFIHIPPYIWFDFSQSPFLHWGLVANPYMFDEKVISLTAMIGAVGGLGIAFGALLHKMRIRQDLGLNPDGSMRKFNSMAMPIWLVWVVIGVFLSALSAPQETIFTAAYTQSDSVLQSVNFDSAWMMSYVILNFAFCDALLERKAGVRYMKIRIILAMIIFIVVYFQFLRGNRESVSWVFGLALIYYYWAAGITQRRNFSIPWLRILVVAISLVVISMVLGVIRSNLEGASLADARTLIRSLSESGRIGLSNATHGTWSAVLLTPLSVAGDHIYDLLPLKFGQDYLNLFLSLMPGFLADVIGYVRPLDARQGPAWEMRYGLGGTHATVVPFMNFRMVGVFLVSATWTFIIVNYEKMALKQVGVIKLSLLASIAMVSPHWLWYGEKYGLNALLMWIIFAFFYRVSLGLSRTRA